MSKKTVCKMYVAMILSSAQEMIATFDLPAQQGKDKAFWAAKRYWTKEAPPQAALSARTLERMWRAAATASA